MAQVVCKFRDLGVSEILSYAKYLKAFFDESETFDQAGERLDKLSDEIQVLDSLEQEIKQTARRLRSLNHLAKESRRRVRVATNKLVNYVNDTADGNEFIAAQGPFPLKDKSHAKGEATTTQILSITNLPGRDRVQVHWSRAKVARSYEVWYTLTPHNEASWRMFGASTSALQIRANIEVDDERIERAAAAPAVFFRVAATQAGKRGPWSAIQSEYVS